MSATLRALKTELKKVEKSIAIVNDIIHSNPLLRIIEIRREAHLIMTENKGDYKKIERLIKPLSVEEKKMFALSKKQLQPKWVDEMIKLKLDRCNLINSVYIEERKANK